MRKILLTLLTTLLCSVTAWAANATISTASSPTGSAGSFFFIADGTAVTAIAGAGGHQVAYNSGSKITVQGKTEKKVATITFTIASGVTITSFTVNGTKNNNTTYDLNGTSVSTFGTAITGLSITSSMTFTLTCTDATSSSSNRNTTITSIDLVYSTSAACSTAPTITVAPSSATYCVGNTATALGYTSATATAQKWQVSTDNSEWNDISPAQTGTTYTPSTASAGTTYYRVIATCDNYTHSATSSAATITVKANHSVTAATSTGTNTYGTVAATSASVCEGSTTTVTASPASGYKVTNWAVTGTGASVSPSGASNSNTTTLTMGTADATVTVTFGCKAPTSPSVSGTTAYTEGDNISLTASATGISASVTYTWYKGATWDAASATSSIHSGATLSINDCVEDNAGTYWCNISNGTGCDVQTSKTITVSGACTDPDLTITLN